MPGPDGAAEWRAVVAAEREVLAARLAELEAAGTRAGEELVQSQVIRRHVARNPERFAPNERESVFAHVEALSGRRQEITARIEECQDRLGLLDRLDEALGDMSAGASALDLYQAVEAERLRIARDLHDGPAQVLSNLVLEAEILERLFKRDPDRVADELQGFRNSVRNAVADMRRFMFDLRPDSLDDLGLVATIRRVVDEWQQQTGVTCRFNVTGEARRLGAELEEALYWIIREALNNVRRHAGARLVEVNLHLGDGAVELGIRDDGAGFDPAGPRPPGRRRLGMVGMRERAAAAGGHLEVESRLGGGTDVRGEFPG